SQTVPAQSHLSLAGVAQTQLLTQTQPLTVASTAEEQWLLLEVALVDVLGHRRVQMVHLVLGAVTGDAEPGSREK
ncbi:hypothetical protein N310_03152, partial [Acanthisitta chloris]